MYLQQLSGDVVQLALDYNHKGFPRFADIDPVVKMLDGQLPLIVIAIISQQGTVMAPTDNVIVAIGCAQEPRC
jgi:hypothetical protein